MLAKCSSHVMHSGTDSSIDANIFNLAKTENMTTRTLYVAVLAEVIRRINAISLFTKEQINHTVIILNENDTVFPKSNSILV